MVKQNSKQITKQKASSSTSLYELLKKWFTWQKVGVILTGLGIIVSIVIFLLSQESKEKEIDIVKNRIFENIANIKNTFKPDEIPISLDTLYDVRLVREFQQKSLQICTLWESVERTEPYLFHFKNSLGEADFVWERNIRRENKCDSLILRIEKIVCELQAYATDNNLDTYQLVNYSLLFKFRKMMEDKSKMYIQMSKKATEHRYRLEYEECFKLYDELREDPKYYVFDDTFFEFLVEANKVYEIAIKKQIIPVLKESK